MIVSTNQTSLQPKKCLANLVLLISMLVCVAVAQAATIKGVVYYGESGSYGDYHYEIYQFGTNNVYRGTVHNTGFVSGDYSVSVPSGYAYSAKIIAPDGRASFTQSVYAFVWWGTYWLPSVQF